MKTRRMILCILVVISLCLCCGCGLFGRQRYSCEIDDVDSIQIVSLDEYLYEEYRFEYTILCEIEDCPTFVEYLNDLEHSVNWGDPLCLEEGYIVIKINYLNGDFDLLYPNAQWFNRDGEKQTGYFFFDKEQFNALVADYLE